ncbi:hypothetical protein [Micromonospora cremea]|uniref:Sporulation and spore germination n=1 Tax=Micromonospora cremea TaxID=709881 RepID=A0A1N5W4F7_9ACTN|nr:hypothetical protein [Micromonospora cremea]SIM80163.1 hypothetical protein SAMN04489832_2154 [Micromonospora cremea]
MTGRRAARASLAGALLLTLLATGCGVRPSDVITGRSATSGPAVGVGLYLLSHGRLALVIRGTKGITASPEQTLGMLAAGPDEFERSQGLASEVPVGLVPATPVTATADGPGVTVTMTGAVRPLSAVAADQIICTVADALALAGQGDSFVPVTIAGPDGVRPPRSCPIK